MSIFVAVIHRKSLVRQQNAWFDTKIQFDTNMPYPACFSRHCLYDPPPPPPPQSQLKLCYNCVQTFDLKNSYYIDWNEITNVETVQKCMVRHKNPSSTQICPTKHASADIAIMTPPSLLKLYYNCIQTFAFKEPILHWMGWNYLCRNRAKCMVWHKNPSLTQTCPTQHASADIAIMTDAPPPPPPLFEIMS